MQQLSTLQLSSSSKSCTCWHLQTRTNLWQRSVSKHGNRQPCSLARHQGTHTQWHTKQKQASYKYEPRLNRYQQREQSVITCQSTSSEHSVSNSNNRKKVLMLGGTGRVGSSTAAALLASQRDCDIFLGSRDRAKYDAAVKHRPELEQLEFVQVNRNSLDSIRSAIKGMDLVVHTAGPFQRKAECLVLEAAIEEGVAYMDVADDSDYAAKAKQYHAKAKAAGVPAITSAGIYPGTSNVMAAHMVSIARREYDSEWNFVGQHNNQSGGSEPKRILYSYYTAGTGGVGPTIMETSFLLAGVPVVVYVDGERRELKPISNPRTVDFGPGLGKKAVWLYHLPEVESTFMNLKVPTVSARFGTDPNFWNWAMVATARLLPKSMLQDRAKIRAFANWTGPFIRFVDPIIGEKVGMRIDVDFEDNTSAVGIFIHKRLSDSVGICCAAFVRSMLRGNCQPGVWFPEEPEALADRRTVLKESAEGCVRFDLNKPAWAIESNPKQLGMGIYLDW